VNADLNWRYATKKFDPSKKIPPQELSDLLEALRFSPSSCGLQPWKFVIIRNADLRRKLRPHAHDQPQTTDADTLIVLCSLKSIDEAYIKYFIDTAAKVRGVARESLSGYEQMVTGFIKSKSPEALEQWTKQQVYIALGFFLRECAYRRIDASPMEGFEPKKFDEILELPKQGLESVVLCAVGYRAADDHYGHLKKVRFDKNEVFIDRS